MENYDDFVAYRLSQLRKRTAGHFSTTIRNGSDRSLIRFYGQSILPPLLSGKQREEMRNCKEHIKKPADWSKSKDDGRLAHVQNILHGVQLRKAPTLQEFVQEESGLHNSNAISNMKPSHSVHVMESKDRLSFSHPSGQQDGDIAPNVPPLTSTSYSEMSFHHAQPSKNDQEESHFDQRDEKRQLQQILDPLADISHQSLSSGYMTYDNAENSVNVSGRAESGKESCVFGTLVGEKYSSGFFLCNPSNTTINIPDIISHPPIDGQKLERYAISSSVDDCLMDNDMLEEVCSASSQKDSVICSLSAESGPPDEVTLVVNDQVTMPGNFPSKQFIGFNQSQNETLRDCPVPLIEASSESSQILAIGQYTTNQLQVQESSRKEEPLGDVNREADMKPFEEPYRLSLQALLKKSQEYRKQQRRLRNQAKNTNLQEKAQEKPREGDQEHSLSDKENEESIEGKKTKQSSRIENQVDFSSLVEKSLKKSWENEEIFNLENLTVKAYDEEMTTLRHKGPNLTGNTNTDTSSESKSEMLPKNKPPVCSPKVFNESKPIELPGTPPDLSVHFPPAQEAYILTSKESTTCTPAHSKKERKYVIPTPQLSMSPVHCKIKVAKSDGPNSTCDPKRMELVDAAQTLDDKFETKAHDEQNNNPWPDVSPIAHLVDKVDSARTLTRSSDYAQDIDQLELNLSSLKLLISDLESTLTENLNNHSQTENPSPDYLSFKDTIQLEHQSQLRKDQTIWIGPNSDNSEKCMYDEAKLSDSTCQRRQSLDTNTNDEDTGPELCDFKDLPFIKLHKGEDSMRVTKRRLVNSPSMGREKNSRASEGGSSLLVGTSSIAQFSDRVSLARGHGIMRSREHMGSKKHPQHAKCITSLAQRMHIPNVFPETPLNTSLPANVISDTYNQPAKRRTQMIAEEEESSNVVSLNQSYDVERPSGLWLLEGSGSDLGSYGPHVPDDKSPESGSRGQVGVSKAKRRLLMHVQEETEEKKGDSGRGMGPVVRSRMYTSTPEAPVQGYEDCGGLEDRQQQPKQMHAALWRALQEVTGRQQQQLLQALAGHYHLLQRMSLVCPPSVSHPGDAVTLSSQLSAVCSQSASSFPERYRPLMAAAVRGFLTRRLLKTERVAQLQRIIKDTQQFLQAFQHQSPGRGELWCRQDMLLRERVTLQLRSARYEVHDIFLSLSASERMQLISWDRELARERELKQQSGQPGCSIGKSYLKRRVVIQQKATERQRGTRIRPGQRSNIPATQTPQHKPGQLRTANPWRAPKAAFSYRR